jgi:hypothetical protein
MLFPLARFTANIMALAWFAIIFSMIAYNIFGDRSYKIPTNQAQGYACSTKTRFTIVTWVSLSLMEETQEKDTPISLKSLRKAHAQAMSSESNPSLSITDRIIEITRNASALWSSTTRCAH